MVRIHGSVAYLMRTAGVFHPLAVACRRAFSSSSTVSPKLTTRLMIDPVDIRGVYPEPHEVDSSPTKEQSSKTGLTEVWTSNAGSAHELHLLNKELLPELLDSASPDRLSKAADVTLLKNGRKLHEFNLRIKDGDLDEALGLFREAKAENLVLPSSVYVWLMKALADLDRVDDLVELLADASSNASCEKAFAAAFQCLGRCGYEKEAIYHIGLVRGRPAMEGPRVSYLVSAYMAGVTDGCKLDEALAVFRRMESAIAPITMSPATFNILIDAACKQGLLSAGFALLEEMQQKGSQLNASSFNPFIRQYCRKMRLDKAYEAVEHMKRIGVQPTNVTFNMLIHASVKADDMEKAYNFLAEMKQQGIKPTVHTYCPIIDGFGRKGLLKRALSVQGEMAADGVEPDAATYAALLHACSQRKDEQRASKLLKDMKSKGIKPTKYVLASMISVLVRSGKLDRARLLLQEAEDEGQQFGMEVQSALLTGLAAEQRVDEALKLYDKMMAANIRPDAYATGMLLRLLGAAGDLGRMFAVFEETRGTDQVNLTLSCVAILLACVRQRKLERAVEFLKEVTAKGNADAGVLFDKIFLGISMGGKDDDDSGCPKTVDDGFAMVEVMRHMGMHPTRLAFEALLDGCTVQKDSRRAPEVVEAMERAGLPLNIFSRIRLFRAFVSGNDGEEALKVLEQIPSHEFGDTDVRLLLYKILQPHYEAAAESPEQADSVSNFPRVRRRLDELAGGRMFHSTMQ